MLAMDFPCILLASRAVMCVSTKSLNGPFPFFDLLQISPRLSCLDCIVVNIIPLGINGTSTHASLLFLSLDSPVIYHCCTCHECDDQHGRNSTDHRF